MPIWSVGHGAREIAAFIALLRDARIETLADVRAFPGSRRHPQFGKDALRAALGAAAIAYEHIASLGGRRRTTAVSPHTALRVPAFRAYADHMASDEFAAAYARLGALASERRTAFCCAETPWWRCHRRLIADRLAVDGWEVRHLLRPGEAEPHRLPDVARLVDGRLVYDGGAVALPE
ncbi:MAG: DUF488 family protein [Candidatus Limnocylindria bacterium]